MPQLSRRERGKLVALLVICALPLGVAGYFSYLEADPHIQLPSRPAAPAPNGFDLYVQAANLSAQPIPAVDPSSDSNPPTTAAKGALRYGRARREAWHKSAAPAWAAFRQAQQTPTGDPYEYGADKMPGYARLRQLARNKNAETRMFELRGEPDKAVSSALDCVEMGYDISRSGALVSRLVGTAICAIGISPLSESSGKNNRQLPEQLTGAQARAAAARLEALLKRRPSYVEAMKEERWMILGVLNKGFERGNWRAPDAFEKVGFGPRTTAATVVGGAPPQQFWDEKMARTLTSKRAVVAHVNREIDAAIAQLKAPYKPRPRAPISLPSGATMRPPASALDPISAQFTPSPLLRFDAAREKAQLDLLLLRLALQAYRADKSAYPPDLNALRPTYLRQIPTDDFAGGKPYNYRKSGANFRLWSVGPDAVNDGGQAIAAPQPAAKYPGADLPWNQHLPSIRDDSLGDIVAGETR